MKITNRDQHALDSQIKNIPWDIWSEVFDYTIEREELSWMSYVPENDYFRQMAAENKLKSFLCFIYGNSNLSSQALLAVAHEKSLDDCTIALAAIYSGRSELASGLKLSDEDLKAMLKSNVYRPFIWAARQGDLALVNRLLDLMSPADRKHMIAVGSYKAAREAARGGHVEVLQAIITKSDKMAIQLMLMALNADVFTSAAAGGHLNVLELLFKNLAPGKSTPPAYAFRAACETGQLAVVHWLINKFPAKKSTFIANEKFRPFRDAAANNQEEVIDLLIQLEPEKLAEMIKADTYQAFKSAASKGHVAMIDKLITLAGPLNLVVGMLAADQHEALRLAVQNGHTEVFASLWTNATDTIKKQMLVAEDYQVVITALINGHGSIIKAIFDFLTPEQILFILSAQDYEIITRCVKNRNSEIIRVIFDYIKPEDQAKVIAAQRYASITTAISLDAQDTASFLLSFVEKGTMNREALADSIRYAIEKDLEAIFHQLIALTLPNELNDPCFSEALIAAIVSENSTFYSPLLDALSPGLLLQFLCQRDRFAQQINFVAEPVIIAIINIMHNKGSTQQYDDFLRNYGSLLLIRTIAQQDYPLLDKLLRFPGIMRATNSLERRYFEVLTIFTDIQLERLIQGEKVDIEAIDNCPYILFLIKNLIRRNNPDLYPRLQQLLSIESIQNRADSSITDRHPNELLQLAIAINNKQAIALLLAIGQVASQAVKDNFYNKQQEEDLSVVAFAESSMQAVSMTHLNRLTRLARHYAPRLRRYQTVADPTGVKNVVEALRQDLGKRYLANPAFCQINGEMVELPLEWKPFESMLAVADDDTRDAMHRAYINHPVHTALRWILQPNPWMSPDASHVRGNPRIGQGSSSFQAFLKDIANLWLAASDTSKEAEPINGFTLETRIAHFVDTLGMLERSHNWDRKREVLLSDGKTGLEYYDDQERDKPTCMPGTFSRLSTALAGHPLFQPLSRELLYQEIMSYARSHFMALLNKRRVTILKSAMEALEDMEPFSAEQLQCLNELNITKRDYFSFLASMRSQYIQEWTVEFDSIVESWLKLNDANPFSVIRLWFNVEMSEIIQQWKPETQPALSVVNTPQTLFAASSTYSPQDPCCSTDVPEDEDEDAYDY